MTSVGANHFNVAGGHARIGVQAQNAYGDYATVVYGDLRLDVSPGAQPEEKYQVGLINLRSGAATKACELIWDAMMDGHRTSDALFHWLVAMLTGRTVPQFSAEELSRLGYARKQPPAVGGDQWAEGIRFIFRLLESVALLPMTPKPDVVTVVKEFDELGQDQRDMLLPHIDVFLDGALKDDLWQLERDRAETRRLDHGRKSRAWKFFQPVPVAPRVHTPQPPLITWADRLAARASTATLTIAVGWFGWELLSHGLVLGVLAYLVALAGSAVTWVNGREWVLVTEQRRMRDRRLQPSDTSASRPPRDGFADKVDALFRRYAVKYVPDQAERVAWEAATSGIRRLDRDEIVTEYRESRIPAERVAWLIRYRIRQSRDRWRDGKLYDYRSQLRAQSSTISAFWAGAAFTALGGFGAVFMLQVHPLADALGVLAIMLTGFCTCWSWRRILVEHRLFAADIEESRRRQADSNVEFERWKKVLADRPDDAQIAAWLDCDRTALLGEAMDHYKLARSRVRAHAFLEEPASKARRSRARNGPMRYSRYNLIVFLLTSDGVRQVTAELGFLAVTLHHREWISYRYDAVASVSVSLASNAPEVPGIQQKFELTLVNGHPISVTVADLGPGDLQQGEDAASVSDAMLDAASVANTLHLLEGIAAEGKAWLQKHNPASPAPSPSSAGARSA